MFYPTTFSDQMGRQVTLENPPKRIVSLVPSQTELLFYLGLKEEIAGITKFCVHPEEMFRNKPRIGGTKQLNFDKIAALKPDLIIGNKEENEKAQVEELMQHYPVWMSNIITTKDAFTMIAHIGQLVNKELEAGTLIDSIKREQQKLNPLQALNQGHSAAYLIWKNPYMAAAGSTFIDNMLALCGLNNAFAHLERYPEVSIPQIQDAKPDLVLLSSEPYPFREKHIEEFRKLCPQADIKVVDGEMFSWYGNRMLFAPGHFLTLFGDKQGQPEIY